MGYTQALLVLLVVSLCISQGITQTPTEVADFQIPAYTSTENIPTSTPSRNVSAQQKIMDELNQRILGLTNTVMRLDEINTRMMIRLDEIDSKSLKQVIETETKMIVRLDEMKNETLNQMKEMDGTIFKRLDEMDTQVMKHLNETDIRIKALEISATNSSEVNRNRTLLLSQVMRKFLKQLDGIETRLQRQEHQTRRKETQYVLFLREPKPWSEAYEDCIKNNMSLASVESEEENNKLVSLIKPTGKLLWLSGIDLGHRGRYVWKSTGRDMTYTQWQPGQPSHSVGGHENEIEHCVTVWKEMLWYDDFCSFNRYYICHYWV